MSGHRAPGLSAAVFDLDGTLIDSAPDIAAAVNKIMTRLAQKQLPVEYVETFIGDGSRSMLSRILDDKSIEHTASQLDDYLREYIWLYEQEPTSRTLFFPEVRRDLDLLRQNGVKLGICTNKPHALTMLVLKSLKIDHLFDFVLGADAVQRRKPHKQHLLSVIEGLGIAPDDAVYVGDTDIDLECAKSAGVRFFLVNWGGGRFLNGADATRLSRLLDILPLKNRISRGIK